MSRMHWSLIWSAMIGLFLASGATPAHADEAQGKLVIVKAVYGDLPDGNKTDVTAQVAGLVKDNTVTVEATNDQFGDPAEGVGKKLKVDYTIDGVAHTKTVNENETFYASSKPSKIVIRKATYGDPNGKSADVTAAVVDRVQAATLSVVASNDIFGDPAFERAKVLKVDYTFDGVEKTKTVKENETLTISDKGE